VKTAKNIKGDIVPIVMIVVLVAAIGFLGWRVNRLSNENKNLKKNPVASTPSPAVAAPTSDHSRKFTVTVLDKKQDDNVHASLFQLQIKNDSPDRQPISSSDIKLRTKAGELLSSSPTMNALFPEDDLTTSTLERGASVKKVLSFKVALKDTASLAVTDDRGEQTVTIP